MHSLSIAELVWEEHRFEPPIDHPDISFPDFPKSFMEMLKCSAITRTGFPKEKKKKKETIGRGRIEDNRERNRPTDHVVSELSDCPFG